MVTTKAELSKTISDFVEGARSGIEIEVVLLYGSYARGTPHEWSDIDLAVISPDFEGVPMWRRQEVLAHLAALSDVRIEPIGYPSSEYHSPGPHSFLREIIRTGRVVYEAPGA